MTDDKPQGFEELDKERTEPDPTPAGAAVSDELGDLRARAREVTRAPVCVTVSAYALGKRLGLERGMRELERQIQAPDRESIPAARCIGRLRRLVDLMVRADTGGTLLGQVRSRHAHEAWKLGAEVWISIDDDVEATSATLRDLLEAVSGPKPRIVVAPCLVRGGEFGVPVVNVELPRIVSTERILTSGALLRPIRRAGFCLVAMNRAALEQVREASAHLAYEDADGEERLALFHDELRDGQWLSEDLAFFARVPDSVTVEALLTGHTSHAGQPLALQDVWQ
jgi:hypothetical protein